MKKGLNYQKSGYVLIISVGLLAVIFMIATSFVFTIMLDHKTASNYKESFKAELAAEAGLAMAISSMTNLASTNFNAAPLSTWSYTNPSQPSFDLSDGTAGNSTSGSYTLAGGASNRATYSLQVVDTQSQLNINAGPSDLNQTQLDEMLEVLGLSASDADSIITNRPAGGYRCKEEIRALASISGASYNSIRDYITVNSYIDANSDDSTYGPPYYPKAPVNINTASVLVLKAVLQPVVANNSSKAQSLAQAISTQRTSAVFNKWDGTDNSAFNYFIENVSISPALTGGERSSIKTNVNPNKVKTGTFTTDFCFHPGGIYEITSRGLAGMDVNADGDLVDMGDQIRAQKTITVVAQIYGVVNYTTKEQFQGTAGAVLPIAFKVTSCDSCPVRGDQQNDIYNSESVAYDTIRGAVKIGFWDDFDEDGAGALFYVGSSWVTRGTGSADGQVWGGNAPYTITDADGDGDKEFVVTPTSWTQWDPSGNKFYLSGTNWSSPPANLVWNDFYYLVWLDDVAYTNGGGGRGQSWPWLVGFPIYRTNMYSGIKDETGWGPGHFTSQERWYPTHWSFATVNPNWAWNVKKGLKFVLQTVSGNTVDYYLRNQSWNFDSFFRQDIPGTASGAVGLCAWDVASRFDKIRVIPRSPDANGDYAYFVSRAIGISNSGPNIKVGTIAATVTVPSSANANTEKVYFQVSSDGGTTWTPALPGVAPGGAITSSPSLSLQFKVNFTINYPGRETPVLEDVTVTYIMPTRILYWRAS